MATSNLSVCIREVWEDNLMDEISIIDEVMSNFKFVSFDTEFPGSPIQIDEDDWKFLAPEALYLKIRENVNHTKLVQIGIALSNEEGELPEIGCNGEPSVWQFNMRGFDESRDFYVRKSLDTMRESGIDLNEHARRGVRPKSLGLFLAHTLVKHFNELTFVCFHGYTDFAYLIKMMNQNQPLPNEMRDFFQFVGMYFGVKFWDLKVVVRDCNVVDERVKMRSLTRICNELRVVRECGNDHQAASDALLTLRLFWKLKEELSEEVFSQYAGILWGLESYSSPGPQGASSSGRTPGN